MRLEGCVRRNITMDLEGHRATSPRDDECGRAPYDERECAQVRMHTDEGVHEAHDTMGFR